MSALRFLPILLALCLLRPPLAAAQESDTVDDRPYLVSEAPLSNRHFRLLNDNKFALQNDGTVLDPATGKPLRRVEMPYVIHRLESSQRLKALLTLNLILNKSQGEKNLTFEEREAVRKIVRETWPVLSFSTRKDFKGYFSLQEQEQLEKDLPDADVSAWSMKDPIAAAPTQAPAAAPAPLTPAVPTAPAAIAAAAHPVQAHLVTETIFPSLLMPPRLLSPPAAAAVPSPAPPAPAPVLAPPPVPVAIDTAAILAAAVPVAPAVTPAAPVPDLGTFLPWDPNKPAVAESSAPAAAPPAALTPPPAAQAGNLFYGEAPTVILPPAPAPPAPAAEPPAPIAPVAVAPPTPPPAPPRPMPGLGDVTAAELEKFLAEGPYGRDAKAMLRLIETHAPAAARTRALNTLRFAMPQVSQDAARAGSNLRSVLLPGEAGQETTIVLRPAIVIQTRKRMFFGETETLLSESTKNYEEAGLPPPGLAALSREAPSQEEKTPWGTIRLFSDGSRRAAFSLEQQAGLLLAELLRLDIRLRGQDASDYNTEVYARTAQLLFYARMQSALGSDRFLDPELRQDLSLWSYHPAEYRNHLVHGLSASRSGRLDPRRAGMEAQADFNRRLLASCQQAQAEELTQAAAAVRAAALKDLAAYEATGLFASAKIEEARKRLSGALRPAALSDCSPRWDEELAGLPKSSLMLAEILAAERKFRQDREAGDAK